MVTIREAYIEELAAFVSMEQEADIADFIVPYSLDMHQTKFNEQNTIYLSILYKAQLVGFMLLVLDADQISAEFRRIVVSARGKGIGQAALEMMEHYCMTKLGRHRIWLDVFEFNERGRHIYEKRGYKPFKSETYEGKRLLFYEKPLKLSLIHI